MTVLQITVNVVHLLRRQAVSGKEVVDLPGIERIVFALCKFNQLFQLF